MKKRENMVLGQILRHTSMEILANSGNQMWQWTVSIIYAR